MRIGDIKDRLRAESAEGVSGDKSRRLAAELRIRDREIERLKGVIADKDNEIETFRQELRQAGFRYETLERSYSTQLEKARERADCAERSLIEQKEQFAELETSHKMLRRDFDAARSRLDMFGPEAASIDEILAASAPKAEPVERIEPSEPAELTDTSESLCEMLDPGVMFARKASS